MKRLTFYNKLVRDGMPDVIANDGHRAAFRTLDDTEFIHELRRKLAEEVAEYLASEETEELADIYTVLCALAQLHYPERGIGSVMKEAGAKGFDRGGFSDRLFLLYVERPEISEEVTYDLS